MISQTLRFPKVIYIANKKCIAVTRIIPDNYGNINHHIIYMYMGYGLKWAIKMCQALSVFTRLPVDQILTSFDQYIWPDCYKLILFWPNATLISTWGLWNITKIVNKSGATAWLYSKHKKHLTMSRIIEHWAAVLVWCPTSNIPEFHKIGFLHRSPSFVFMHLEVLKYYPVKHAQIFVAFSFAVVT